jgi:peptide/nickel transport system substrate-binding protein
MRLLRVTALATVMGSMLLAWRGAQAAPATSAVKPKGTATVAFHSFSKEVMDPAQDGTPGLPYRGQMFDWFISATPEGKLTTDFGALERYEANADATIWTFALRKGIKWHDGAEMTAEDIKFTVEHYARPTTQCTQCGAVRGNLDYVEVADRYTAHLHLKKPDANIPAAFGPLEGDLLILPKHYYEKVGAQGFEERPLGSGPWKFVKREIGQFIEYEANLDYWNPERIPGFAKLRMVLVPEARTRVAMLKRGEAMTRSAPCGHVTASRACWS